MDQVTLRSKSTSTLNALDTAAIVSRKSSDSVKSGGISKILKSSSMTFPDTADPSKAATAWAFVQPSPFETFPRRARSKETVTVAAAMSAKGSRLGSQHKLSSLESFESASQRPYRTHNSSRESVADPLQLPSTDSNWNSEQMNQSSSPIPVLDSVLRLASSFRTTQLKADPSTVGEAGSATDGQDPRSATSSRWFPSLGRTSLHPAQRIHSSQSSLPYPGEDASYPNSANLRTASETADIYPYGERKAFAFWPIPGTSMESNVSGLRTRPDASTTPNPLAKSVSSQSVRSLDRPDFHPSVNTTVTPQMAPLLHPAAGSSGSQIMATVLSKSKSKDSLRSLDRKKSPNGSISSVLKLKSGSPKSTSHEKLTADAQSSHAAPKLLPSPSPPSRHIVIPRLHIPKLKLFGSRASKQAVVDKDLTGALPDLATLRMVDVEELAEWQRGQHKPILLDFRKFPDFNAVHVDGSFNVNLPSMMVQRYRRGSLLAVNLENFICEPEGKEAWRQRTPQQRIVLLDRELPFHDRDRVSMPNQHPIINMVATSLAKEMGSNTANAYWLKGGFKHLFRMHNKNQQWSTSQGEARSMRTEFRMMMTDSAALNGLVDADSPSMEQLPSAALSLSTPDMVNGESTAAPGHSGRGLFAYLVGMPRGLTGIGGGKVSDESVQTRPATPSPTGPDYHSILPYLILGSDPCLYAAKKGSNVSPLSKSTTSLYAINHRDFSENPIDVPATAEFLHSLHVKFVINFAMECPSLESRLCGDKCHLPAHMKLLGYHKMGMTDSVDDELMELHLLQAVELIDRIHQTWPEMVIYVHCLAGKSRSATIVMAYIMKTLHLSTKEAYDFVKSKRPVISPNLGFISLLQKLEPQLLVDRSALTPKLNESLLDPLSSRDRNENRVSPPVAIPGSEPNQPNQ